MKKATGNRQQATDKATLVAGALWRHELIERARSSSYRGELADADAVQEESNPLCGDVVKMFVKLQDRKGTGDNNSASCKLQATSYTGHGCIISQSTASLLCEYVQGKSPDEVLAMSRPHIEELFGAALSPSRVKCAMLPLVALQKGLRRALNQ